MTAKSLSSQLTSCRNFVEFEQLVIQLSPSIGKRGGRRFTLAKEKPKEGDSVSLTKLIFTWRHLQEKTLKSARCKTQKFENWTPYDCAEQIETGKRVAYQLSQLNKWGDETLKKATKTQKIGTYIKRIFTLSPLFHKLLPKIQLDKRCTQNLFKIF